MENIIVYFILFSVTIFFAHRASQKNNIWHDYNIYIAIITFSLVVGLRWNVGLDYPTYLNLIQGYLPDYELDRIEYVPREMMILIQKTELPFYIWFISMACIQIVFLYLAIDRLNKFLLSWGTFFFLCLFLDFSLNIIRQVTALSVVLCAYVMYEGGKKYVYILLCVLAYGFHHSSLVIAFFIPLLARTKDILSTKWQIILFSTSICFKNILPVIFSKISFMSDYVGYATIFEAVSNGGSEQIDEGSGIGVIFNYITYYFIILNSQKIKGIIETKSGYKSFVLLYNSFFIGICAYTATMYDMLISRFFLYFTITSIIVYAATVDICIKSRNVGTIFGLMIVFLFIVMQVIKAITSDVEWQFVWDAGIL